jgi:two-component system, cell cycle response regulator DivK
MNQQPSVLVLDKNLHDLEFINSCLKSLNITYFCAREGIRTLIWAQLYKPSLIFLDMALSDLSSTQIVSYLKLNSETSKIPIIGCISVQAQPNADKLLISGVSDYIFKPYDCAKIKAVINKFFG